MTDALPAARPGLAGRTPGWDGLLRLDRYYRDGGHAHLPHIAKFSGGRSSAAMVLAAARAGALRPDRGDAVLFANTTAEHPQTYLFAARVCDELEAEHGLACLWYEFCTVETIARTGRASRSPSYRLVARVPAEADDPPERPGYRDDGSAMAELAGWKLMLPNRLRRICTEHLKLGPGHRLLQDWLTGRNGPEQAGHNGAEPMLSPEERAARYRGTALDAGRVAGYAEALCCGPHNRPQQLWADFTCADTGPPPAGAHGGLWGSGGPPLPHVVLLGLRADEPRRVRRMEEKSLLAEGATSSRCRDRSQPPGEYDYAPLALAGAGTESVRAFWAAQPYDLGIDGRRGNCVFCPMKGAKALARLASEPDPEAEAGKPSSFQWWADMEDRYARPSQDRPGRRFGWLGIETRYAGLVASSEQEGEALFAGGPMPCACTD